MNAIAPTTTSAVRPVEDDSDESLMTRYSHGEDAAFEMLFRRHQKTVRAFIRGFVDNPSQWDDILQSVFIKVARFRRRYRPQAKFTTWLYAIVRTACIDALRKDRRERMNLSPGDGEAAMITLADSGGTPRDNAITGERDEELLRAIHSLPQAQREVLMMRETTSLTFDEIGEALGCSANTVKSRMHYALTTLRTRMIEQGIEP